MPEDKCHVCGKITDWYCERCEQPVCDECSTPLTIHNQCTETRCVDCNDSIEAERAIYCQKKEAREEAIRIEREKRNEKHRHWYNSDAQVERRRLEKIERKKRYREIMAKTLAEAFNVVNDWLK